MHDYSDRDLLALLDDMGDLEGFTTTGDVATQVFGTAIEKDVEKRIHAERCVGIRLSWMKRYGVVEMHPKKKKTWRLSRVGRDMLQGTLGKAQQQALESARDSQLLHLGTALADRYVTAGDVGGTMLRRAWQLGMIRRRGW